MFEIGRIDQEGKMRMSDRVHSRYHDLMDYILTNGEDGAPIFRPSLFTEPELRHDWKKANDVKEMLKKDASLVSLLSDAEKKELSVYLRFAYENQVRNILMADNPRDFVYRAAETIGAIKQTQAWPLPNHRGNHR